VDQLNKYDKEDNKGKVENKESDSLPADKEVESTGASKTQGTLPKAPDATSSGGTATKAATMVEGDKMRMQSVSMASGG
jgi:hypothetical protein